MRIAVDHRLRLCRQGLDSLRIHRNAVLGKAIARHGQGLLQQGKRKDGRLRQRFGRRIAHAAAQVVDQLAQPHDLPVQPQCGAIVEAAHAILQGLDLGAHGGERRAQLVRHVRQPGAPRGLDGVQTRGHVVEGAAQQGQFVRTAHLYAGAEPSARHVLRTLRERIDRAEPAPRQLPGQHQREDQADQAGQHDDPRLAREERPVGFAVESFDGRQHQMADDQAAAAYRQLGGRRHIDAGAGDPCAGCVHHAQPLVDRICRFSRIAEKAGRRRRHEMPGQELQLRRETRRRTVFEAPRPCVPRRQPGIVLVAGLDLRRARIPHLQPMPGALVLAQLVPAAVGGVVLLQQLRQPVHAADLDLRDIGAQAALQRKDGKGRGKQQQDDQQGGQGEEDLSAERQAWHWWGGRRMAAFCGTRVAAVPSRAAGGCWKPNWEEIGRRSERRLPRKPCAIDRSDPLVRGRDDAKFAPQVLDVAVDRAIGHVGSGAEREFEQACSRIDVARMPRQHLQEAELAARQIERCSVERGSPVHAVEHQAWQVLPGSGPCIVGGKAPQHGAHACDQLAREKGLHT